MLLAATPAQADASYRVRWGDTLTWIAQDHHISLSRLAHVNGLDPYGVLVEGTVLRIPPPRHHARAAEGDARQAPHPPGRPRPPTRDWGATRCAGATR